MGKSSTPSQTGLSRVFIIEGRARGDHAPAYQTCLRMAGVTWGQGAMTSIECPSDTKYDEFEEVGKIKGAKERPSTSLEGLYAMDVKSELLRITRKGCSIDVQLHLGDCTDPTAFSKYKKVLIFEDVNISNWTTGDLGALASGDRAKVNETGEISAKDLYEVLPLTFAERAGTIVTNEVLDVTLCDSVSCGECDEESDGCQRVLAITKGAGGSPGTPPDVVTTIDGGATWFAHDIDSILTANDPTGIACLGLYVVITCATELSLNYALLSEFNGFTDPTFTKVTTGFVAGGGPQAIDSVGNYAFIVGNGGYVYGTSDPTAGVTVLDAGVATPNTLFAVDVLNDSFAVAVGANSTIIKTEDGTTWTAITPPTGVAITYNCIAVKSTTEWWIGTSTGYLYYTTDGGVTWAIKAFTGSSAGAVEDIVFATDSVAYLSHTTAAPHGRILRSIDGGNSWIVLPESTGTLPANDKINAIVACAFDPNNVVGGGLADLSADGFIVVGAGP